MRKIVLNIFLFASTVFMGQTKNTLLDSNFWKKYPDVIAVQAEIAKGNDPSESNASAMDAVTLAINNGASNEVVKFLLTQKGNEINKPTHDERIYLHWATAKGNIELVNHLIGKGADINREDHNQVSPLVYGLASGQVSLPILEAYVKAGLDLKKRYKNNANLIMLAVAYDKDLSITQYLVSKGLAIKDVDTEGNTVFNYATRTGNIANLKALLAQGVKYTPNALIIASEATRRTANSLELYKYLVEELKINPKTLSTSGQTVLHNIVRKENQSEIVNYFLEKGVEVTKKDADGVTALHVLAIGKEVALLEKLLSKGAILEEKNAKGETALTYAVKTASLDMIAALIQAGANVQVVDNENQGLLYHLIQNYRVPRTGNDEFLAKLNLLKEKGLSIVAPQKDDNTLYHLAIVKNDLNLLKKLEGLGIAINAKNKEGLTLLHKAALLAKDDAILKYVLSLGADKSIKTEFDETAYDLAKENEVLKKNQVNIEFLK
ncbi:ankyrin repeat domain-containing protein [Flavobacterium sp.]|uniref:ankyrin repeat domain-containing protein n=1 Tax=Flavobacterium sp. TaxID=239 RepID=UPI003D0BC3AA